MQQSPKNDKKWKEKRKRVASNEILKALNYTRREKKVNEQIMKSWNSRRTVMFQFTSNLRAENHFDDDDVNKMLKN